MRLSVFCGVSVDGFLARPDALRFQHAYVDGGITIRHLETRSYNGGLVQSEYAIDGEKIPYQERARYQHKPRVPHISERCGIQPRSTVKPRSRPASSQQHAEFVFRVDNQNTEKPPLILTIYRSRLYKFHIDIR